jgi:gluconolactonase
MRKIAYTLVPLFLIQLACSSEGTESPSGDGDATGDGDLGSGGLAASGGNSTGSGATGGSGPSSGGADPGSGGAQPGAGGSDTGGGENGTGGADPGAGGSSDPGTGGAASGDSICPPGSESLTVTLSNVTFTPVPNLINNYQGFGNFEGPVWLDGALYYSNISGGASPPPAIIWKVIPGGTPEIVVNDSGSNGMATDGTKLFAAMHSDGAISSRELTSPEAATVVVGMYEGQPFDSPNDLVLTSSGDVYFTDPPYQAPDGRQPANRTYFASGGVATALATDNAPNNPNGITLSKDAATLFIGGQNGVFRYNLNGDGSVQTPGTQILTTNLTANSGVDGLGRDCAGNIYVTVHEERRVVVLSPAGAQLGALDVPSSGKVTNVAFGGADRTTLFVTSLGETPQIHQATLNVPGYPY